MPGQGFNLTGLFHETFLRMSSISLENGFPIKRRCGSQGNRRHSFEFEANDSALYGTVERYFAGLCTVK